MPGVDRECTTHRYACDCREARLVAYTAALQEIRNEQGKVCDNYELCTHRACQSSYTAWAIADKALGGNTK